MQGHGGAQLILQADGDAILDAPGNVTLWSTNTSNRRAPPSSCRRTAGDRASSAA
jgi:hypothetical protein